MVKGMKSHWGVKVGAVATALMLSGCAEYHVRKLHSMTPTGSEYSKNLTEGYKVLSLREIRKDFDGIDSKHFAMKGQEAAMGKDLMPEELKGWDIPGSALPEVMEARKRLVSALKCGGMAKAPKQLGWAVVYFDWWVEQLEERWQRWDIQKYRLAFYEHLRQAEEILCPYDKAPKFHVHFRHDSDKVMSKQMMQRLDNAVKAATENCHCKVFLIGRTDASGKRAYNLDLSKRRAETVKKIIMEKGIEDERIVPHGFGEVPGSAQHNINSRRVNIIIH